MYNPEIPQWIDLLLRFKAFLSSSIIVHWLLEAIWTELRVGLVEEGHGIETGSRGARRLARQLLQREGRLVIGDRAVVSRFEGRSISSRFSFSKVLLLVEIRVFFEADGRVPSRRDV